MKQAKKLLKRKPAEIEALIENWRGDPCFDLEEAEGFEYHRKELTIIRRYWENEWHQQRLYELTLFAADIGLSDNLLLAEYLQGLEAQIKDIRAKTHA